MKVISFRNFSVKLDVIAAKNNGISEADKSPHIYLLSL